jgi:hypothetical protein
VARSTDRQRSNGWCRTCSTSTSRTPDAAIVWNTLTRGPISAGYVPLDDRSGIDLAAMITTLRDVGYDGWFTVHQPLQPGQAVEDAIRESYGALAEVVS